MFHKFRYRLSVKYRDKLIWLKRKKNESLFKNIKPIRYSCLIEGEDRNEMNSIKFTLSDNVVNPGTPKIEINIEPEKFANLNMDLLNHTNNKWFINLSNTLIPKQVSNLLQLGGNFGLPIDKFSKKKLYMNLLRMWKVIIGIYLKLKNQKSAIQSFLFSIGSYIKKVVKV